LVEKQVRMKEALKYSPLAVSGYAWSRHADGLYYKDGRDNHAFMVYDYVEGKEWLAFDSYDNSFKELEWNYNFGQVKRFSLNLNHTGKLPGESRFSGWITGLINKFKTILNV